MVTGSRRPWFYFAAAAVVILFITVVSFNGPREKLAGLGNNALSKVCDNAAEAKPVAETITKTVYLPVATDAPLAGDEQIQSNQHSAKTHYTLADKPPKRVIGLIFAGRRRYLHILDCYLKRNLVKNGGWLDNVVWVIKTNDEEDIAFVNKLVEGVPEYSSRTTSYYGGAYEGLEGDAIYVKIDDDVLFFEDHTIPTIVTRMYENPQYTLVSANVMNQPALSFVHYHLGAIHPYLPESKKPADYDENKQVSDWRVSGIPHWQGNVEKDVPAEFENTPFKNHKWQRLERESDVSYTPCGKLVNNGEEYNFMNAAWRSWALAAQEHYSFLENLEKNELWRYKFDMWNYHYERLSINFIAFDGQLVLDHPPPADDEKFLTEELTRELRRPAILDGSAIAVHFGFFPQTDKLGDTDLLQRYLNFAEENICGKPWGTEFKL